MNKGYEEEQPPNYDSISPIAPPVTYTVPSYTVDSTLIKGVPPGLQCLLQTNQLSIQEKFSVSQGWGRLFDVLDMMGQHLYQASQYVQCCGPIYNLKIRDNREESVMEVLETCGCRCTRQMEVFVPSFGMIGMATVHNNTLVTHVSIKGPSQEVVLLILGPSFLTNIFGNTSFEVKSRDEQHVVGIIKSDGNKFTVTFPMDLEVTMKALLLAACFYLESLIYSKRRYVATRPSSD